MTATSIQTYTYQSCILVALILLERTSLISRLLLSKFYVKKIVLVTVIWYCINIMQIFKRTNVHNILKLSTLKKLYLNCSSDSIVRKGSTKNTKLRSIGTVRNAVWCAAQRWYSNRKENTFNILKILCTKNRRLV